MRHRNRAHSRVSVADARAKPWQESDAELISVISLMHEPSVARFAQQRHIARVLAARLELERRFRIKHGIRMKDFLSPEYQMLFRIEYPELTK